jgi:hypothetical protein
MGVWRCEGGRTARQPPTPAPPPPCTPPGPHPTTCNPQVDIGAEFDGLLPIAEEQWQALYASPQLAAAVEVGAAVEVRVHRVRDPLLFRFPVQVRCAGCGRVAGAAALGQHACLPRTASGDNPSTPTSHQPTHLRTRTLTHTSPPALATPHRHLHSNPLSTLSPAAGGNQPRAGGGGGAPRGPPGTHGPAGHDHVRGQAGGEIKTPAPYVQQRREAGCLRWLLPGGRHSTWRTLCSALGAGGCSARLALCPPALRATLSAPSATSVPQLRHP